MTALPAALPAAAPVRSTAEDFAWIAGGAFALALCAQAFAPAHMGGATAWWASAALGAVLATAPRPRWRALSTAFAASVAIAQAVAGASWEVILVRTLAGTAEGAGCGAAAAALLARTRGAVTPLAFAGLMTVAVLLPPVLGATIAALLEALLAVASGVPRAPLATGLAYWSGDSFGALGLFPLALALRRDPPGPPPLRQAARTLLLVALVALVTRLSFASVPQPFAFCSLVLGAAALVAGMRTMLLLVWVCMVSAAWSLSAASPPPGAFGLRWQQLNVFLPVMAIALPIQVLSIALQRIRQSHAVLHGSRERYRALYERAPVMLQSLDGEGRTTEVNAQWLSTLGYEDAEEVRGLPFARFVDDAFAADPGWHRRLLAGGTKLHVRLRTRDGRPVHALASAAAATDEAHGRRGVVLALEDVSVEIAMRQEIERERAQLAALTSATNDLAIFLDRELRYATVNRAFERYWRLARGDVLGRRPADVPGQDFFAREIATPLARALEGNGSAFRATIDFPHGRRVMEVALAPAYDAAGARAGVVATLHDVTELVDASRELRVLVEDLQHANEGLEQFARIASHDLREPLNTVSQFAGLIEHDFGPALPPEARRWFDLMGRAALRMKAMLDDVLSFARLERPSPVALEVVALDRVMADLRVLLHARLDATHAEIVIPGALPQVMGQAGLLELLFQNLLLNAMRHATPGLAPRIEIGARRVGAEAVVTVCDNGVGIPDDELERVFMPFHRRPDGRREEGSGLELASCRRIAATLGGRIWAESGAGRGTRMHVALQAAE
jgi:PAS domain S-box-containing protein